MRIRPGSRLACAAAVALAVCGPRRVRTRRASSRPCRPPTTATPICWRSARVLRQTDETLAQAVANWRPKVSLSVEYQQDRVRIRMPVLRSNTYYALNGRHDAAVDHPADLPRRQDGRRHQDRPGQHPGAARRCCRHRADGAAAGRDRLCRSAARPRHRRRPQEQRPGAGPAARRHARALPGRRAHHHRRLAGRGAPRAGQGRPGAGRGAGAHRSGDLPAHRSAHGRAISASCR